MSDAPAGPSRPRAQADDTRRVLLLLGGVTLLRLLLLPGLGLGDAEAYYWVWSQHLSLSYYDHPPGIALLIRALTDLGASSPFWVRLGPVLLFPVTVWLLVLLGRELAPDDPGVGLRTALICVVTPALALGGVSASPDTLLAVCWSGFLLLLVRALTRGHSGRLLGAGLCLGLGLVAKYFALLAFPLLLALFVQRRWRGWWRRPALYLAALLALVGLLPALLWNAEHDWVSFRFHLVERHGGLGPSLANLGRLVGGQLGYLSPVLLVGLLWALAESWRRRASGRGAWQIVVWLAGPYLGVFFLVTLLTPEAEPHWPLMGFLPLFPALAAAWPERLARTSATGRWRLRRAAVVGVGLALLLDVVGHVHVLTPWLARCLPDRVYAANARWDIASELHGWPAVGARVRERLAAGEGSFAFAYHYTMCAQLSLALHPDVPVYCPNRRTDAFDLLGLGAPPAGGDGIFVGDWRYTDPPDTIYRCRELEAQPEILEVARSGLKAREFRLWRCRGYGGLTPDGTGGR